MSPENSTVVSVRDTLEILYEQVASFNEEESILIGGDFNARVGNLSGWVTEDIDLPGKWEGNSNLVSEDKRDISIRERVSEDGKTNVRVMTS